MAKLGKLIVFWVALILPLSSYARYDDTYANLADIINQEHSVKAIQQANRLLSSYELSPKQRTSLLMAIARWHYLLDDLQSSIDIYKQAQSYAHNNQLIEESIEATKQLGILYYYTRDNTNSLLSYHQALAYYEETNQFLKQAHLLNNIALINVAMNDLELSLAHYQRAQVLYRSYGNSVDQTDVRFNIAGLYNRLDRYDLAIKMYQQVIEERQSRQDHKGLALAYGDIGIAYFKRGEYESAQTYYLKSLNYFQQQNNNYATAMQLANMAEVLISQNAISGSLQYANQAIDLARQSSNMPALMSGLHSLSLILFTQGKHQQAYDYLLESSAIAKRTHAAIRLADNQLLMALIQSAQQQELGALENVKNYQLAIKLHQTRKLATNLTQYQAKLESENLQKELQSLLQKEILQQLELEKTKLQYAFGFGVLLLLVLIMFYSYRSVVQRRLKDDLTEKVKQRTQALELLLDNLRKTNDVKSQFLANMSHEIRTPLTAVIGQAEAIMAGDIPAEFVNKEVEIIYSNSHHLLDLLNDILDLSRIEANKLELSLKPCDINHLINDIQKLFLEQANKKQLEFIVINDLPMSYIMEVDALRLKQILINLCSNAIKFTYQGQVSVHIYCEAGQLIFDVKDSGIGLDKSQLEKIFEHFTQGDSSINRRFGGSGLGLCLSQQLALMMNGNIHVESENGQGSLFSLSLPMTETLNVASDVPQLIPSSHSQVTPVVEQLSGMILLADDHNDNRHLTKRLLELLGLNVMTATNGIEVLEQFKKRKPDLILLDIQMPEMGGIEAFQELKLLDANMPIIALTANAMSHEIEYYLDIGFDDYVSKPLVRSEFIRLLAFHLKQVTSEKQIQVVESMASDDLQLSFIRSFSQEIDTIYQVLHSQDYQALAACSHRISGAAALFGFDMIASISAEVEQAVKGERFPQAKLLAQRLVVLLQEAK